MGDIKEAQGLEVVGYRRTLRMGVTTLSTKYTSEGVVGHFQEGIYVEQVESLCRISDAQAVIDQLRERVEELEVDVAKWKSLAEASQTIAEISQNSVARMDALKAQQKVVMPERAADTDWLRSNDEYNEGWNDCLDEVARRNGSNTDEQ